jgi:hypothetical protein
MRGRLGRKTPGARAREPSRNVRYRRKEIEMHELTQPVPKQQPKKIGRVLARTLAEDLPEASPNSRFHTFTHGVDPIDYDID